MHHRKDIWCSQAIASSDYSFCMPKVYFWFKKNICTCFSCKLSTITAILYYFDIKFVWQYFELTGNFTSPVYLWFRFFVLTFPKWCLNVQRQAREQLWWPNYCINNLQFMWLRRAPFPPTNSIIDPFSFRFTFKWYLFYWSVHKYIHTLCTEEMNMNSNLWNFVCQIIVV